MPQNKPLIITLCSLMVLLLFAGIAAFAAELGSKDDPVVTLSYLLDELQPQIMTRVDETIASKKQEIFTSMETQFRQFSNELDAKIASFGGGNTAALADDPAFINAVAAQVASQLPVSGGSSGATGGAGMLKVEVPAGKTLTASLNNDYGLEIVLRLGNATCVASASPGIIDLTTGSDLAGGSALEKNHLYIATIKGRGFKATNAVTVFVRGEYTIQ